MAQDDATTILVVDDEEKLTRSIEQVLRLVGFSVLVAFDGETAIERARGHDLSLSLVVLDLNLPKRSGFEVLSAIRERDDPPPVLILSALDKVEDRVRGLQLGADDYLVKPFEMSELVARIEALLRRAGRGTRYVFRVGDLTVDVLSRKVTRGDVDILLSPKQFALLEFLVRNKNQILTRRRIAEHVWGYTFDTGTNIVDVHINHLRKAIDRPGTRSMIQTVYGEGYVIRDS